MVRISSEDNNDKICDGQHLTLLADENGWHLVEGLMCIAGKPMDYMVVLSDVIYIDPWFLVVAWNLHVMDRSCTSL